MIWPRIRRRALMSACDSSTSTACTMPCFFGMALTTLGTASLITIGVFAPAGSRN